jgi:4-amino-4-deoxy-L-arabinose transferase-like glycosyltransferase
MDYLYFVLFTAMSFLLLIKLLQRYPHDEKRFLFTVLVTALCIRLCFVIIFKFYPEFQSASDAGLYEKTGLEIANAWKSGAIKTNILDPNFSYYIINAIVYYIFGFHPIILKILNSLLGVVVSLKLYETTKMLKGIGAAKIAVCLLAFFPSLIFNSTCNLKDILILLLLTVAVSDLIILIKTIKATTVARFTAVTIFLVSLRFYMGFFVIIISFFVVAFICEIKFYKRAAVVVIFVLAAGIILYKLGYGVFGIDLFRRMNFGVISEFKHRYKVLYPDANSNVFLDVDISTLPNVLKFLPIGFLYFMFSPFPWEIKGALQLFTMPENLAWYVLIGFFSWRGIAYFCKKENLRKGLVLFLISGVIIAFYSLTITNIGTSYRMRYQLLPMFFIFISVGIDLWKPNLLGSRIKNKSKNSAD